MATLHSFADLTKSPEMLADEFARTLFARTLEGQLNPKARHGVIRSEEELKQCLSFAGKGSALVSQRPGYKAALWLLHPSL